MTVDPSKALPSCLGFLGLPPHDMARAVAGIEEVIERLIEERDENEAAFKAWRRRCMDAEGEALLAIAHDRQPYPTAWAYERACEALEKHRLRADSLGAAVRHVVDNWDQDADVSALRRALDATCGEEANTGCEGGHVMWTYRGPGEHYERCSRCGNRISETKCGCGEPEHEGLGKSFCPNDPLYVYRKDMA